MKRYIYILLLTVSALLLSGCGTSKKVTERETRQTRDSVSVRDSVVMLDSVVVRYERQVLDSVVIRDSVVLTLDAEGNVVGKETWRTAERSRNASTDATSVAKQEERKQSDAASEHEREDDTEKTTVKTNAKRWWLLTVVGVLIVACAAIGLWRRMKNK